MPIPNPNDPRMKIASALQRLWGGYQDRLPGWAKEEYGLPDIGGGFTDTFPNAFGAGVEALYNTARDATSVNPSVDIPIALAALATGGGALAARGITKHGDEAAEGISRVLKRGYQGDAPLAGSRGVPHTSQLPNPSHPRELYPEGWYRAETRVGGDPRVGFGDNAAGTIRGDVDLSPPPNDFAAMDNLGPMRDPDESVWRMLDGEAQPPFRDPTRDEMADWLGWVDDQRNMTDAQLAMSDADSFTPWNQYDQEMYGEFEKLMEAGVTPDEAIDILAIQYGDILDGDIVF